MISPSFLRHFPPALKDTTFFVLLLLKDSLSRPPLLILSFFPSKSKYPSVQPLEHFFFFLHLLPSNLTCLMVLNKTYNVTTPRFKTPTWTSPLNARPISPVAYGTSPPPQLSDRPLKLNMSRAKLSFFLTAPLVGCGILVP